MTDLPTLTAPPTAPSRSDDSDTFVAKADALVAWFPTHVAELNEFGIAVPELAMAINYNATSASSVAIATGVKAFTADTGKLLQIGQYVIAASAANPANYMAGQVTSYDATSGALTLNVTSVGGSGTYADWVIGITPADVLEPVAAIAVSGSGADLVDFSTPLAKLVGATTASVLMGRWSGAGGGVWQQVTLGSGLTISASGVLNVSTGTATVGDGTYADIVISSSGTVYTIGAKKVTFAKIQDLSANVLIGSSAGGVPVEIPCTAAGRALIDDADAATQRTTLGIGTKNVAEEWALNFTANGDSYIPATVAMTINQGNAAIGTGTLAYAKSTAAVPGTFTTTTLPATLEAGAWLKVTASGVSGFKATHLKRTV